MREREEGMEQELSMNEEGAEEEGSSVRGAKVTVRLLELTEAKWLLRLSAKEVRLEAKDQFSEEDEELASLSVRQMDDGSPPPCLEVVGSLSSHLHIFSSLCCNTL